MPLDSIVPRNGRERSMELDAKVIAVGKEEGGTFHGLPGDLLGRHGEFPPLGTKSIFNANTTKFKFAIF